LVRLHGNDPVMSRRRYANVVENPLALISLGGVFNNGQSSSSSPSKEVKSQVMTRLQHTRVQSFYSKSHSGKLFLKPHIQCNWLCSLM